MRNIRILEPGPLATVQDRGRFGFRSMGVPLSGAMDLQALRIGNLLVGNTDSAAGIEITLGGFRVEFCCDADFAVTGAHSRIALYSEPVPMWQPNHAGKGDILTIGPPSGAGLRTYLTVSGGIDVDPVMASRSTYVRGGFGGFCGRMLRAGDELPLGAPPRAVSSSPVPRQLIPEYSSEPTLRVIPGPQDECISEAGRDAFFSNWYDVTTRADRMGISLSGPVLDLPAGADIISDGTCPGAVQVHGNGLPTILGADCQTTGGYVKIAVVISSDLPLVAQLSPGDRVRFEKIDLWQAREIYMRNEYVIRKHLQ